MNKYDVAAWGLSYNSGWAGLTAAARELAAKFGAEVYVKEKLGGLVLEWSKGNDESGAFLYRMGRIIEIASRATCQVCGQHFNVQMHGVCWSLCRDCRQLADTPEGPERDQLIEALKARAGI